MAEPVTLPGFAKLLAWGTPTRKENFCCWNYYIIQRRKNSYGCGKFVQLSALKMHELNISRASKSKIDRLHRDASKCTCLGSLVDFEGASTSDVVPVIDQVLLMVSIFLTYITGVIPVQKSNRTYSKMDSAKTASEGSRFSDLSVTGNIVSPLTVPQSADQVDWKIALSIVRSKLSNTLVTLESGTDLGSDALQIENKLAKRCRGLSAVSVEPRLRLLWVAFQHIEEEVNNISIISGNFEDCFPLFSNFMQKSCWPVFMAWLKEELCLQNNNGKEVLFSLITDTLKGDSIVLKNTRKSGKEALYEELLCYLSFGSIRGSGSYEQGIYVLHGIEVLEDMVITLADDVANLYLELISVDSEVSSEINRLNVVLCTLSTRAIQRLRNEVALQQWLYQYMDTVVSMYEDRFDLCTLQSLLIDVQSGGQSETPCWWKRFNLKKSEVKLHRILITYFCLPIKRTKELRALEGWRYYFSLFLEFSDITMPLVIAVTEKVRDAISFFLVSLIGRSLGLIYTGIRQSLRWK